MSYTLTIGLEVHLKLASANKLFCRCENTQEFDMLKPNTNICPTCTAQPGALPVLNTEPLLLALKLGKALKCTINKHSTFDRKSYFYPDQPSGYQITQFYSPTCTDGQVNFFVDKEYDHHTSVGITDAHIETDTGKTIHINGDALLDYNRAGTPLVEIVTDPDFHKADEVVEFLKELQRIARYNKVSDADMEKGQMRVDVNISLSKDEHLGTRTELKNLNSFGAIKRAIAHEYQRQATLLDDGQTFEQETRMRDDVSKHSVSMRSKEDALDYRYFPDPDLPGLTLDAEILTDIDQQTIEIPYEIITKMKTDRGFHKEYINTLIADKIVLDYFRTLIASHTPKIVAKRISGQISFWMKEEYKNILQLPFDQKQFGEFLSIAEQKSINSNQLKIVMDEMLTNGKNAKDIIKEKGFTGSAIADNELERFAQEIITAHPAVVQQYLGGKTSTIGFFIGQMMKKTRGQANPEIIKKIMEKFLHT